MTRKEFDLRCAQALVFSKFGANKILLWNFSVKHLELVKIILTFVAASVHNVRLTVRI